MPPGWTQACCSYFARAKASTSSNVASTAGFCMPGPPSETDIRMIYAQGGGTTMDLGCYPISWVRHLMGEEPVEVSATAVEGPPDVDLRLFTEMQFANGVSAKTRGDMGPDASFEMSFEVTGSQGKLRVQQPLVPQIGHSIELTVAGQTTTESKDRRSTYGYQLDAFIRAVEQGEAQPTDAEDAVKQMQLIDRCYAAAGMKLRGH